MSPFAVLKTLNSNLEVGDKDSELNIPSGKHLHYKIFTKTHTNILSVMNSTKHTLD